MGFLVKAAKSVVKTAKGVVSIVSGVLGVLVAGPKKSKAGSANSRLNKTLNPEDFRKIIFGKTASALDLRYWEVYGTNGTQYDEVIAMASHQINAVKELYIENDLAIDASNNPQGKYVGVLTRASKLGTVGQTALSVGAGGQYTAAAKMTGVAHMVLKWVKNDDKLPNGPPSRYTNIVEGALVYDPRRDSTQPGGSGTHRINDQSTWAYSTLDSNNVPIGRNNALQALWYLLGWRVANPVTGELVLVAGRGIDPNDINIQTFITGANNCEAAGYYTDMILSTEDDHTSNEDKITADGLIATLIDPGGLWSYYANVNDTASVAVYFTDDDILDSAKVSWNEYKGMSDQYNQVVGKFVDPSATALYQPRAYPMVRDATYESNLGVKRRKSIDFEQIQDALLAQKLARLSLNQGQYQAEFSANFGFEALKAQAWSIVSYTSERFGWTKLFRVYRYSFSERGIAMTLREVNASIWTAGSVITPVTVPLGTRYDPTQAIALAGLTATAMTGTGTDGTIRDGITLAWTTPTSNVKRTEVQIKLNSDTYWQSFGPFKNDVNNIAIFPLMSGSLHNIRARHVSVHEVPGAWATANFTTGTASNVEASDIITSSGTAAAIVGQGPLATSALTATQVNNALQEYQQVLGSPALEDQVWPMNYANTTEFGRHWDYGGTGFSFPVSTATGSICTQVANVTGDPFTYFIAKNALAFDANSLYEITIDYEIVSFTNGYLYAGIRQYDKSGNVFDNAFVVNSESAIGRRTSKVYIKGLDAGFSTGAGTATDPRKVYDMAASGFDKPQKISILVYPNYYLGQATCRIHKIRFRKIAAAAAAADSFYFGDNYLKETSGGSLATLSNFKTSLGVSSAISGQGALATQNSATWATQVLGAGKPADNATVGARSGTNIYRTDGTTVMTQAEIRTAEGVASAITSQGALATLNSVGNAQIANLAVDKAKVAVNAITAPFTVSTGVKVLGLTSGSAQTITGLSFTGTVATDEYLDINLQTFPLWSGTDGTRFSMDAALLRNGSVVASFGQVMDTNDMATNNQGGFAVPVGLFARVAGDGANSTYSVTVTLNASVSESNSGTSKSYVAPLDVRLRSSTIIARKYI